MCVFYVVSLTTLQGLEWYRRNGLVGFVYVARLQ